LKNFLDAMTEHGEKYFQLEEMEDAETCTTEVYINSDFTVRVGQTNGPKYQAASGSWTEVEEDDGIFEMILKRSYATGREKIDITDLGEYEYTVERRFTGTFTFVGAEVNVEGSVHDIDEVLGDRSVGFFSMIDVTKEREGVLEGRSRVS
jgi:hypothetical protein